MPKVVIASRKSDLARIQAQSVGAALQKAHPGLEVELLYRESLGDKNQHDPLWKMPEKGVFTQDFREDLLAGRIDVVVHSWKDLPTDMGHGTCVIGALPRADQRDLLLIKKTTLARGTRSRLKILSSSPRRAYNLSAELLPLLPSSLGVESLDFADIRGNVPTRIRKTIEDESADGLVLAKAGIDRLLRAPGDEFASMRRELREMLEDFRWSVMPLSLNPTAAAQGALALEIREDRPDMERLLKPILCERTTAQTRIERIILKKYGGGCHQKIGVSLIDHAFGPVISLRGKTDAGEVLNVHGVLEDYLRDAALAIDESLLSAVERREGSALRWASASNFDARQTRAACEGSVFPRTKDTAPKIFDRKDLAVNTERLRLKPLMVARTNALPANFAPGTDQVIWTAGVPSWHALAARGCWVSGTCDSLGEEHEPGHANIEALAPEQFGQFTKLTHETGATSRSGANLATYALVAREGAEADFDASASWYFWMSGSAFLWAIARFPQIKNALHSCGPGNTLKAILEHVAPINLRVYPNYETWSSQISLVSQEEMETPTP